MVSTAEYYRQNEPARKRRITQQKKYQKTANKLRAKLGLKVGDPRDAAHYAGSKTKGRPQAKSTNRASRSLKIRNT